MIYIYALIVLFLLYDNKKIKKKIKAVDTNCNEIWGILAEDQNVENLKKSLPVSKIQNEEFPLNHTQLKKLRRECRKLFIYKFLGISNFERNNFDHLKDIISSYTILNHPETKSTFIFINKSQVWQIIDSAGTDCIKLYINISDNYAVSIILDHFAVQNILKDI